VPEATGPTSRVPPGVPEPRLQDSYIEWDTIGVSEWNADDGPRRRYVPDDEYVSPRDLYITIYGRMPVLEALNDPSLDVAKLVVADNANGHSVDEILQAAKRHRIPVERAAPGRIKLLAGNGKQDQGVVADISAPRMAPLNKFIARRGTRPTQVFLLDGVTNPSNVGMIIRSVTAAGLDGVILPRQGTPHVGPLVIKASAGVAFRAPIVNAVSASQAIDALRKAGYRIYGLSATSRSSLFSTDLARQSVFVLGGETTGISVKTDVGLSIPMHRGVESLNVAVAAAVVAFEIANRGT
jgi:23S rRNA (guanosine2251-2'-O)-methyltransferase